MKINFMRTLIVSLCLIILHGCSFNDLTDLLSDEDTSESEIVIREIPTESFDPEDTEEILVTDSNSDENDPNEITIVETEEFSSSSEDSLDTILSSDEESETVNISNGKVPPIFTYVGQRILDMQDEYSKLNNEISTSEDNFQELRANGIKSAENYHAIVAAIAARLQIGTTPGNPILLQQYEEAQTELASVGAQGQNLVDVGNQIALLSTRVSYLLEQARSAKKLRGAVDEDHRNLSSFQDNLKRRSVDVVRILEELNETVRRRDIFLAAERRRLTQLANAISIGESFGLGLGTIKSLPVMDDNNTSGQRSESNVSPNPIAIFRVNREEDFEQNLFGAVSAALDKAPEARFTLVAVSSSAGNASEQAARAESARLNVSKVISSLISMGMPADRLSVSSLSVASVENTEVRLYAD